MQCNGRRAEFLAVRSSSIQSQNPWLCRMDEDLTMKISAPGQHIAFIWDCQLRAGYRHTERRPGWIPLCAYMVCDSLILLKLKTFLALVAQQKYHTLLLALCLDIMCFLDFTELNNFFWHYLYWMKTSSSLAYLILGWYLLSWFNWALYLFLSLVALKTSPFLPALCLDLLGFLDFVGLHNFFLTLVAHKKKTSSLVILASLIYWSV